MSLVDLVRQRFDDDIFENKNIRDVGQKFKILVLDKIATKILNCTFLMHQLGEKGISMVDSFEKNREPTPSLDVIYIIDPTAIQICNLINDFDEAVIGNDSSSSSVFYDSENASENIVIIEAKRRMTKMRRYRNCFIFFLRPCSERLFEAIGESRIPKYCKALTEINLSFIPIEEFVFTIDTNNKKFFNITYSSMRSNWQIGLFKRYAFNLATLFQQMETTPIILFRNKSVFCENFISFFLKELGKLQNQDMEIRNPSTASPLSIDDDDHKFEFEISESASPLLLVLDRGFDPIPPFLHDIGIEAIVRDCIKIEKDTYTYEVEGVGNNTIVHEVALDRNNKTWDTYRHMILPDAIQKSSSEMTNFVKSNRTAKRLKHMGERMLKEEEEDEDNLQKIGRLRSIIQNLPEYQRNIEKLSLAVHIVDECNNLFKNRYSDLTTIEQILACQCDKNNNRVQDFVKLLIPFLKDVRYIQKERIRLIILYCLMSSGYSQQPFNKKLKDGVLASSLNKLLFHSGAESRFYSTIINLKNLGVNVLNEHIVKLGSTHTNTLPGRNHDNFRKLDLYENSRYVPYLLELTERIAATFRTIKKFDHPILKIVPMKISNNPKITAKFVKKFRKPSTTRTLIIFIIGGVTHLEIRYMKEAMERNNSPLRRWNVLVGSDHIIIPNEFLDDLHLLSHSYLPTSGTTSISSM
ncbi:hypothetical protein SNEBB_007590 [Seison nebaliae]|nr:hypothetical protein SNEBB_007590 [Seison nebaliae]